MRKLNRNKVVYNIEDIGMGKLGHRLRNLWKYGNLYTIVNNFHYLNTKPTSR